MLQALQYWAASPYAKTMAFFVVNSFIAALLYLAFILIRIFKLDNLKPSIHSATPSSSSSSSSSTSSSNRHDENSQQLAYWTKISGNVLLAASTFLWYSISLSFTVYNKWILQVLFGGFHFPICNTLVHMTIKYIFSQLYIRLFLSPEHIPELSTSMFWKVVVPIGVTTAFDVAFSNEAISHISISLYTIIKTTVVVWTFLWGCVAGIESFSLAKLSCIMLIIAGLALSVLDDINSSILGISFCMAAALSGGLRWVMVQVLGEQDASSKHPVVSMYRFSGATVCTVLPLAILVEMKPLMESPFVDHGLEASEIAGLILLGGFIAVLLMIVELYILTLTSSLTLSVLGEMKEVFQIAFAMAVFHDHVSFRSGVGLVVVLLAAELYRNLRHFEKSNEGEGISLVLEENRNIRLHSPSKGEYQVIGQEGLDLDSDPSDGTHSPGMVELGEMQTMKTAPAFRS